MKKTRKKRYEGKQSLQQIGADFVGEMEATSLRGRKFGPIIVDSRSQHLRSVAIEKKSESVSVVGRVVEGLDVMYGKDIRPRVIYYFRPDSAPVWPSKEL